MKKLLITVLIASMLILPVSSVTPADAEGTLEEFLPGNATAEMAPAESMVPALHGIVLAMLNHNTQSFDRNDPQLAWESLYNMLSLYGQLDSRSVSDQDELLFPEETVLDYAAALDIEPGQLGDSPAALRDRLNYDNVSRCYPVVCGEANLAQIRVDSVTTAKGSCLLTGALVYEVENQVLARFQAVFQPRDNMFGCAVTSLTLR